MSIIIGITGSIASGKTTVAKIMSGKKYPLFSADKVVAKIYKKKTVIKRLIKELKLDSGKPIKKQLRIIVKKNEKILRKIELIIHPLVRKEMKIFLKRKNKILILEIPLLIESNLNHFFDKLIFVGAKISLRKKRYLSIYKDKKIFNLLNKRQIKDSIKRKTCDHVINNNQNLLTLNRNAKRIISMYE